ncbi:hypothetical protein GCM10022407_41980 [Hymenobacter antarcticus]|uniref:Uncharacterized protein n=1 Tax=Hymenobacter antarcticus TaxID=486270 RepID=A0ABP7R6N5_9BACT
MPATGRYEFKKPVYESKFTKWPKGMSFVNAQTGTWSPAKVPHRQQAAPVSQNRLDSKAALITRIMLRDETQMESGLSREA